jgi:hypothetical protein
MAGIAILQCAKTVCVLPCITYNRRGPCGICRINTSDVDGNVSAVRSRHLKVTLRLNDNKIVMPISNIDLVPQDCARGLISCLDVRTDDETVHSSSS